MDGSWEENRMFVQHELERLGEEQGKQWKAISEIQRDVAAIKGHVDGHNPGRLRTITVYGSAGGAGGLVVSIGWVIVRLLGG